MKMNTSELKNAIIDMVNQVENPDELRRLGTLIMDFLTSTNTQETVIEPPETDDLNSTDAFQKAILGFHSTY